MVGRTMELSGTSYEIAGVMPPGFDFPDPSVEYWLAWDMPTVYESQPEARTWRFLQSAARLRSGIGVTDAEGDLNAAQRELALAYPQESGGWEARVTGLQEEVTGGVRGTLLVALGAVAVVLLLACANVANLILARSPARARELAVRSALGADRSRLGRQLLIEHLVLSGAGALLGLVLALGMLELVGRFGVGRIPRLDEVGLDGGVLAFIVLLTMGTSLLFGLAPLVHLVRDPVARFVGGGAGRSVAGAGDGLRKAFVVVQVALALVLLVGASLFGESLNKLRRADLGFDPQSTLTFRLSLDSRSGSRDGGGDGSDFVSRYYDTLMEELLALPGIEAAGAAQALPISPVTNDFTRPYRPPGSSTSSAEAPTVNMRMTTAGYFDAVGMRFLSGGPFTGL
ncbi:MAG: FtsX-like permease family protein, partial [Longimicrobiales bacterium]